MGPLVKNKEGPVWVCWTSHVALLRFVTRRKYTQADKARVDILKDDFIEKFGAVSQWKGYEKPKLHMLDHLAEALECVAPCRHCFAHAHRIP